MDNFNLNESNANGIAEILNALDGLKTPVLAFLGLAAYLCTLIKLDENSDTSNINDAYVDCEAAGVDS